MSPQAYIEDLRHKPPTRVADEHLIDNWTLQEVGQLLRDGLTGKSTSELQFITDGRRRLYASVSADVVKIECLCQTLHNLVFSETCVVDDAAVGSWKKFEPEFEVIQRERLVVPKAYSAAIEEWRPIREAFADELCVTPVIKRRHEKNVATYTQTKTAFDPFLSQVLWGTAGLLARAHFARIPYTPHPLRERVIAKAGFVARRVDAQRTLDAFVESQRVGIFKRFDSHGFYALASFPAVALEIIRDCRSKEQLLPVALQYRGAYRKLRSWVTDFQRAFDAANTKEILQRQKILQSIAHNLNAFTSTTPVGETSVEIGLTWPAITTSVTKPLGWIVNRFGVRAQINRLVMAPAGRDSLMRLLRLFGEENSALGQHVAKEFILRSAKESKKFNA